MRRSWILLVLAAAACGSPQEDAALTKSAVPDPAPADAAVPAAKKYVLAGRVVSELDEPVTLRVDTVVPWLHGMEKDLPKQHFESVVKPGDAFRFEGLDPGVYWVRGESRSSARWENDQVTVTADVLDHEVQIRRACTVVGHVTLGDGINPGDCWIDWTMKGTGTSLGRGVKSSGRFRIERLEPGPISLLIRHWPDRDANNDPGLRVESRVEATLVPGENVIEWKIDGDSTPAK